MAGPIKVNIGTKENPVWLSQESVSGNTPQGQEFWEGVASGSVVLSDEALDRLLSTPDEKNS